MPTTLPSVSDIWRLRSLAGEIGEELLVQVLRQLHLALHLELLSARRSSVIVGGGGLTRVRPPGIQLALLTALAVSSFAIRFVTVLSARQDLTVTNVATLVS